MLSKHVCAADRYWVASAAGAWGDRVNWSERPGGAGGASVPNVFDVARFDGAGGFNGSCSLTGATAVGGLSLGGYTGTIDLRGFNLTSLGANTFTTGRMVSTRVMASLVLVSAGVPTSFAGTSFEVIISGSVGSAAFAGSTLYGDLTVTAESLLLNGATFHGTTSFIKTGASVDESVGGNTFHSTTTITNAGTGTLRMAVGTGDTFNGPVTFVRAGGILQPAYNQENTFTSDVITNSSSSLTFGAGDGTITFAGGNGQVLSRTALTAGPVIRRLVMNKPANKLTLLTTVTIGISARFVSGIIDVPVGTSGYMAFEIAATVVEASNASYVDGIVKKRGNSDFVFPIGDGGVYRPITITGTTLSSVFAAQFFRTPHPFGINMAATLHTISACEYWTLDRESGQGFPYVTLRWQSADCSASYVSDPAGLVVAHWNGTLWDDYGTSGYSVDVGGGSVTSRDHVQFFSPFVLASITPANPLPVTLDKFEGAASAEAVTLFWETASEIDNDYFTVQRSSDGVHFENIGTVAGAGTTRERHYYTFRDLQPLRDRSYYRLQQTDFDKRISYSDVIVLETVAHERQGDFYLYPNPAHRQWVGFSEPTAFRVLNALGRPVLTGEPATGFDASSLPAGIYWVISDSHRTARLVVY
jgi:hypothetical protein